MSSRREIAARVFSSAGVGLLVLTGGLWFWTEVERVRVEREITARDPRFRITATVTAFEAIVVPVEATLTAIAIPSPTRASVAPTATPQSIAAREVVLSPTPTATPIAREIYRIAIPSIDLDAPVIVSRLRDGQWEVPKFVAGHLETTALPGQGGNVVLSGHVQSLSSGNVFARLSDIVDGDTVVLRTDRGDVRYRITGRSIVPSTDVSVTYSTGRDEVTLITCTGTFNPLTGDYSHRLVVWGEPVARSP